MKPETNYTDKIKSSMHKFRKIEEELNSGNPFPVYKCKYCKRKGVKFGNTEFLVFLDKLDSNQCKNRKSKKKKMVRTKFQTKNTKSSDLKPFF